LINVLRGEMSLVGPRPERAIFVKQLAERIPFYAERFMVRPGITGWAQVMQSYAANIEESRRKLQADLFYIKHMSFPTDLYILLKTVKIVLLGRERGRFVQGTGVAAVAAQGARSRRPAALAASAAARPAVTIARPFGWSARSVGGEARHEGALRRSGVNTPSRPAGPAAYPEIAEADETRRKWRTSMSPISLVLTLIVAGGLLWLVNNDLPMDAKIEKTLNIVVSVF
jgi:hypothetical protein